MTTLQIHIDDTLKKRADALFSILGLELQEAVYDSRFRQNLNGPFDSAEDAVASMLKD